MADNATLAQKSRADQNQTETTRGGLYFTPRVDIYETDHELTLYADLPGVRSEDVDLRYEQGELMLHGRVRPQERQANFLLAEYDEGDFYRVFQIHESIDASKISAECKNGVLTVHLPKAEAARPRQIEIRGD
jgi:HSP20 family molecular chaperone IbpA